MRYILLVGTLAIAIITPITRADIIAVVGGTRYDVSTITTTFSADAAQLQAQPFWGNQTLAFYLAGAVGTQLGSPNSITDPGSGSRFPAAPFFALETGQGFAGSLFEDSIGTAGQIDESSFSPAATFTYALATEIPETPSRVVNLAIVLPFLGLVFARVIQRRKCAQI